MTMSDTESMPRINKLPDAVANQIAAGEVIERPVSVVKELIENSLDAAASKIHIELEQAGIGLIRVRDNGQGIHKEDLSLALEAHATSKLSTLSDLSQIVSMGFRGEAIPSIASVSRFKMTSRLIGSKHAWCIDERLKLMPAAHEMGTTVEVKDLFYGIPGRRKFLKSEKTEYLHIQALIRAISLSHFSTALYVKHNNQSLFNLPACNEDIEQRVTNVCGRSFIKNSVQVDIEKNGMRLWGWLGLNEVARSQSDRQYFFVNNRIVRDKHVSHAIRLAYDDRIATGRYPSYVLHLEIDPAAVDVNVHPAKSEVRFAEIRDVHDFIYSSLMACLQQPKVVADDEVVYDTNNTTPHLVINEEKVDYDSTVFVQRNIFEEKKSSSRYFTLFNNRFLLALVDDEHYLIDIAASRVCITQNKLIDDFKLKSINKRPILVPLSCELNQDKIDIVEQQRDVIEQWGFELEQISPTQILIRTIPTLLIYADAIALVEDLLEGLNRNQSTSDITDSLALHVNDSGTALDDKALKQLIQQVMQLEQETGEKTVSAWRRLDASALASLLDS